MSEKLVTDSQGRDSGRVARAKGITREQWQDWQASLARFMDAKLAGERIIIDRQFTPPPGGRLHRLTVPVTLDRPWPEAVTAADPNTSESSNIWEVGDLYPPTGVGQREENLVLLNFSENGSWGKAIAWGKKNCLSPTVPRQVFAVGEHYPNLHRELGLDPMWLTGTTECSFDGSRQAADVWWSGAGRGAGLGWLSDFGSPHGWFAFSASELLTL